MLMLLPFVIGAGALTVHEMWKQRRSGLAVRERSNLPARVTQLPATPPSRVSKAREWLRPKTEAEADIVAELKLASAGLCLGTAGLFFFPLQIAGVLFLLPTMSRVTRAAYRHLRYEKRVSGDALTSVLIIGGLAGGFFYSMIVGAGFFVLVRWLTLKTEYHSKQGIVDLFGQHIRTAWLLVDGVEVEVPLDKLRVNDCIVVRGGQVIPSDCVVVEGNASVDQHILTGEAQPVEKGPGDHVFAATMVRSGRLALRVQKAGGDTIAAQIVGMLTDTREYTASLVSRADAFNDRIALPFIALGGVSVPFVGLSGGLSILAASPGYRMVFFGPLSMFTFIHMASQSGILIKDGRSLEALHDVDTVVFDKTGTLTIDQPHVARVLPCPGVGSEAVLAIAAAAESRQTHPIARAIVDAAAARGIELLPVDEASYLAGFGIEAQVDGKPVRVGSFRYMEMQRINIPASIRAAEQDAHAEGKSLVLVAVRGKLIGAIVLEPTLRQEAADVVDQLQSRGLRVYIMSGDHAAPTRRLADDLGLDGWFAEVLPAQKAELVRKMQAEGLKVCFIGAGINDSIALKSASVSVSLSGSTTIAIDSAQIVLMDGSLKQIPSLFDLASGFRENMRMNMVASTAPSFIIIGGALFFGMGLLTSLLVYQISVPFALYNTARPLLEQRRKMAAAAG